ncbi:LytR/AlgR family response regulator transcription factor [Maribacter polysaccharolyticus]|uniref:LytR/AlgR family response regulator transcription factor n=1 Tax=Maribacter polysaccharolyticus TaxID=3020831 RepID=UPI00237F1A94|nr:LytTR family DNA-binding domain-containing protein [Maribacter polysaccharolyticus]MDE3743255.1 LytTR family DNA-binding domain-containing protein [Maribacter polysaccharolyticus]
MIRAVALDDEPLALEVIRKYCRDIAYIDLVQTFTSQDTAIAYLDHSPVDLIFLDIQMPQKNGIELYTSLTHRTKVIFTTAFSEYAVDGFNLNATDYLLKPYSFDRFLTAIEKAGKALALEHQTKTDQGNLSIRADYKLHHIPYQDILFIEALDDYIKIHLDNQQKIVARHTMKGILKKLPPLLFKRVHRSYIVSLKKINALNKDRIAIQGYTIPMSNTYKKDVLKDFNN